LTDQTVATALLAAAPLATVIVAMAVLRWSAISAGAAGLAVALVLAASVFAKQIGDRVLQPFLDVVSDSHVLWDIIANPPPLGFVETQEQQR